MNNSCSTHLATMRRFSLTFAALACVSSAHAVLNIPDTPLQTGTSADPNIVMIMDDSGSMHWEITPDSYSYFVFPRPSNVYGSENYNSYVATTVDSEPYNAFARSPQTNLSYYNPGITYLPWAKSDGSLWPLAVPSAAYHNPAKTSIGTRNLTTQQNNQDTYWEKCTSATSCSTQWSTQSYWPATYFWYNGGGEWTRSHYTKVEIRSSTLSYSGHGREARTDCTNGVCTYLQEIQNFANWYTYYRSRVLTARAGVGRAFSAQGDGLRVGFAAINAASSNVDGADTRALISGVRKFSGTDRSQFFTSLYGRDNPVSNTPLRRALGDIGNYYKRDDNKGPWSTTPGETGGTDYACRQSYAILMTDGYWTNGSDYEASLSAARADNDSTDGPTHTGPNNQSFTYSAISPFRDGRSNTLADVASYYWKTDLRPEDGVPNAVPTSTRDPAFWQHMVTFGVGLGVTGSVSPDTAFAQIGAASPATVTWPDPTLTNEAKLDDLLHAAVNSRGAFFNAKDPAEFSDALTDILSDIVNRKSSSASVSTNSTKLTTSSMVFSATFNTNKWTGELEAFRVGETGVADTPTWRASEKIPAHNLRKIFTVSSGPKEFVWSNLNSTDQTALGNSDVVAFIRGDRSKETENGGTLRSRGSLLGDIVHSSPYYSKDTKLVLVGANDGMLHAFNADTGVEQFAYIPSPMLAKLAQLSQTTYEHKFFVDGDIVVGEKSQTFLTKTYAVATLGRGGKGLFGLDITNPASFGAANAVWEYVSTTDKDLGYMLGKPIIAQMNNDTTVAIVGNGYNSTNGVAVLYIINLETGAIIKKISTGIGTDNGLSTPSVYDENADGYADYIYAGDLKGNVWKFDVTSSNANQWKVANSGSPFFVAKDASGNLQPITSQITMAKNYVRSDPNLGKLFLFFGTGAYFRTEDPQSKAVQSWYAVIDEGTTVSGRNVLKQRGLDTIFTVEGKTVRSFKPAIIDATSHDMTGWKGWYMDWMDPPTNIERGERIITPSAFYRFTEPVLLVSSIIPSAEDPCQPGGTGFLNAVNAFTGGSLSESFFLFSSYAGTTAIGSLDMDLGMLSQASIFVGDSTTGQLVVSGSGNTQGGDLLGHQKVNTGVQPRGRVSWREIIKD